MPLSLYSPEVGLISSDVSIWLGVTLEELEAVVISLLPPVMNGGGRIKVILSAEVGGVGGECFNVDTNAAVDRIAIAAIDENKHVILGAARIALKNSDEVTHTPAAITSASNAMEVCIRVTLLDDVIQPIYIASNGDLICSACAATCHAPGTVRPSTTANITQSIICQCGSTSGTECLFAARIGEDAGMWPARDAALRDRLRDTTARSVIDSAVSGIVNSAPPSARSSLNEFASRLVAGAWHIRAYSDTALRVRALREIPLARILREAAELMTTETTSHVSSSSTEINAEFSLALLKRTVHWFKYDYFKWVNEPPCMSCGGSTTGVGNGPPNSVEILGGARHVEIFRCTAPAPSLCNNTLTRFPRYNKPSALLESKRGRCGEWANAFTLFALSLGYDARHVTDWTDHVWTEVKLASLSGRWVHVDSCEAAIDVPRLYERGWGKKLSFVIAAGERGVVDVAARYAYDPEALSRRAAIATSENVAAIIAVLNNLQSNMVRAPPRLNNDTIVIDGDVATNIRESFEFSAATLWDGDGNVRNEEKVGRISGSLAWRADRNELGEGSHSSGGRGEVRETRGWRLHSPAISTSSSSSVPPLPLPQLITSWGKILAAVAPDGKSILWRHAASTLLLPWRPVQVTPLWPPTGSTICGLAAASKPLRLWVFTCKQSIVSLWLLTPGCPGDVIWKAVCVAKEEGEVEVEESGAPPAFPIFSLPSVVVNGDKIFVLRNGSLYRVSMLLTALAQVTESPPFLLSFLNVAPAMNVTRLTATQAGTILGFNEATCAIVVLVTRTSTSTHSSLSSFCQWVSRKEPIEIETNVNEENLWLALPRVALPTESSGDALVPSLSMVEDGLQRRARFRFPASCTPIASGIYEPRLLLPYSKFTNTTTISNPSLLIITETKEEAQNALSVWSFLAPAAHLVAIALGPNGGLLAITEDGDTWTMTVPKCVDIWAQ